MGTTEHIWSSEDGHGSSAPLDATWPRIVHRRLGDEVILGISIVWDRSPARPARLVLVGALCSYSATLLDEVLDELIEAGASQIDVRVPKLRLCTAAGLSVLLAAHERLRRRGGALRVWEPQGVVRRVLECTRIDEILCPADHRPSGASPRELPPGSSGRSRSKQPVA